MLHLLLLIARNIIAVKWRNPQTPTVTQWRQKLREVYVVEALTATLQLRTDVFGRRWLLKARCLSN